MHMSVNKNSNFNNKTVIKNLMILRKIITIMIIIDSFNGFLGLLR